MRLQVDGVIGVRQRIVDLLAEVGKPSIGLVSRLRDCAELREGEFAAAAADVDSGVSRREAARRRGISDAVLRRYLATE